MDDLFYHLNQFAQFYIINANEIEYSQAFYIVILLFFTNFSHYYIIREIQYNVYIHMYVGFLLKYYM